MKNAMPKMVTMYHKHFHGNFMIKKWPWIVENVMLKTMTKV
jgi:hypothetical protein